MTWGRRSPRATLAGTSQPVPPGPQRVAVVVNPVKARAARAIAEIERACADAGWPAPAFHETTVMAPGGPQAQEALASGAEVVVAAGGDGTVRAVAAALARTGVPMGVLPIGTANLLGRNLGLTRLNLPAQVRAALFGGQLPIDIGQATVTAPAAAGGTEVTTEHIFLVVAGMGVDARAVAGTREGLKKRLGWVAYGEAGLRHLGGPVLPVAVAIDGAPAEVRPLRSVLVGNCGLIPAGIDLMPAALLDDGTLDVAVMAPVTPLGWSHIAGKLLLRHRAEVRSLQYHAVKAVDLRPPHPLAAQLDGDVLGLVSALSVRVAHHALLVRLPDPTPGNARPDMEGRNLRNEHPG